MHSPTSSQVLQLLLQKSPGLEANPVVFQAIQTFFQDTALIDTHLADLRLLLKGNCLFRVQICRGSTLYECALDLIDNHPECLGARGMLRYYRTPEQFQWQDCEKAETELGNALTLDTYAWQPDSFTLFNDAAQEQCELVCILAFDSQ